MTPEQAYEKALKEGPSDETRNIVLSNPEYTYYYVYYYARNVDKKPRNDTRRAVLSDSFHIFWYIKNINKKQKINARKAMIFSNLYGGSSSQMQRYYIRYMDKKYISYILL